MKGKGIAGKLVILSVALVVILGFLIATLMVSRSKTIGGLATSDMRNDQSEIMGHMELAGVRLTLAAMDAIIDWESGEIDSEVAAKITKNAKVLRDNTDAMLKLADTGEEKKAAEEAATGIKDVTATVETNLKRLVETSARDKARLEAAFHEMDDDLDVLAQGIQDNISAVVAMLEAQVAKNPGNAQAVEDLMLAERQLTNLLQLTLAAMDAIVDKDSGEVADDLRKEIEASSAGLEKGLAELKSKLTDTAALARLEDAAKNSRVLEKKIKEDLTTLITKGAKELQDIHKAFAAMDDDLDKQASAVMRNLEFIADSVSEENREAKEELGKSVKTYSMVGLVVSIVGLCTMLVALYLVGRSIVGPLNQAIGALRAGSEQVSSASSQISQSSQQLAEGATEQASSLEESSSALEELSGQAKGNAEIATETSGLMSAAKQTVGEMSVSIDEMVETMGGIKDSSGKISGILKTIEEIAFQTNLLALNAAVEAARAGEHGKGFAVVAEEVRNLAQRSAVAAKDTAALIESSVSQADKGAEVVTRVADDMHKVAESAGKVAENVDAIAQASQQQSEGIEQINNAVAQMDKVTQQVASNAEESASASEEMAAQSSQMHSIVGDLMVVVAGARSSGNASARQEIGLAHHAALSQKKQETKPPEAPKAAKAIPFDDDEQSGGDFSEF